MTLNDYQFLAGRTINPVLNDMQIREHALHLLVAEVGELHGLYQKTYQGHAFNEDHAIKECGDILWGVAEYCTAMGWTMEDVARMNIDKLKARFPDGFSADHSLHRAEGDI